MTEVALFPIPNVVAFPGTVLPLHVFEPRYRQMVADCTESGRMIAVCHTKKEIRAAKQDQTVQDALKTNQATYEPQDVFSAGTCDVMEETSDGRIYINIRMSTRLRLQEEIQTLPYRVVTCTELNDSEKPGAPDRELQRTITSRLLTLIGKQNPELLSRFDSDYWLNLSPTEFSFKIFQLIRLDPDIMQAILETTTSLERMQAIQGILDHPGGSFSA